MVEIFVVFVFTAQYVLRHYPELFRILILDSSYENLHKLKLSINFIGMQFNVLTHPTALQSLLPPISVAFFGPAYQGEHR